MLSRTLMSSLITLTTDFGDASPYVAVMKGVILSLNPAARLLDLSHRIRRRTSATPTTSLAPPSRTSRKGPSTSRSSIPASGPTVTRS